MLLTTESGESLTIPNDVVFVLTGSDADLTLLKQLGVKTEPGKLTEVPIYNPETFETSVRGVYVAGHFTHARHIKAAIDVPRRIVPLIAKQLREKGQPRSTKFKLSRASLIARPQSDEPLSRPRAPPLPQLVYRKLMGRCIPDATPRR